VVAMVVSHSFPILVVCSDGIRLYNNKAGNDGKLTVRAIGWAELKGATFQKENPFIASVNIEHWAFGNMYLFADDGGITPMEMIDFLQALQAAGWQ
jgi:hypothetical protein